MTQPATIDNTPQATSDNLPEVTEPYHKGLSIEHILEYRDKDLSHEAIAKILGCARSNVTQHLARHQETLDRLDIHKKKGADILQLKGMKILDNMTEEKLKAASAYQLAGMYGIMHQNERLKRDQSTANIAYKDVSSDVAALEAEIAALEGE